MSLWCILQTEMVTGMQNRNCTTRFKRQTLRFLDDYSVVQTGKRYWNWKPSTASVQLSPVACQSIVQRVLESPFEGYEAAMYFVQNFHQRFEKKAVALHRYFREWDKLRISSAAGLFILAHLSESQKSALECYPCLIFDK